MATTGNGIVWTNGRRRLGELVAWAHNPRFLTDKQATRLRANIRKFGYSARIEVEPDNTIVDGHQRDNVLLLMEEYGPDKEIDVLIASRKLTLEERQEYVAMKHAGAVGSWDWNALASWDAGSLIDWGFDGDLLKGMNTDISNLSELLASENGQESQDAEPQFDRAEELQEKWQVQTGDLWELRSRTPGNVHRVVCGDCTDREVVEKVMGGERASMVWTDPPYGVNYGEKMDRANPMGYRVRTIENDNLSTSELEKFLRSALKFASINSNSGASIYVASPAGTLLPTMIAAFIDSGFDYHWGLIWLKDQIVLSRADYHFKHENILYGWKSDGAHYFIDDRTQPSVFEYPRPKISEEHPTMKPVELVQHMINNSSRKNEIIYDPFLGSGTTLIAAENLSRQCRGVEIAEKYVAVSLERYATAFPGCEIRRVDV